MTWNTNDPYSGEVEYGTVNGTAPGDVVTGGNLTIDPQVRTVDGIGMKRGTYASYYTGAVSYDVLYPVVANLSAMVRASATNSVAAITCVAGTQDGEWALTSCLPTGFTANCAVGDALTCNVGYLGIPEETDTGGTQGTGAGADAEAVDFVCTVDGGDYYVQNFSLTLNTNAYWFDAMNSTASRAPTKVLLGVQDVTLRLGCASKIPDAVSLITAAAHDADIDVILAATGLVTFTISGLTTPVEAGTHQVGALKVFDYDFQSAVQVGGLTIAAS